MAEETIGNIAKIMLVLLVIAIAVYVLYSQGSRLLATFRVGEVEEGKSAEIIYDGHGEKLFESFNIKCQGEKCNLAIVLARPINKLLQKDETLFVKITPKSKDGKAQASVTVKRENTASFFTDFLGESSEKTITIQVKDADLFEIDLRKARGIEFVAVNKFTIDNKGKVLTS